MWIRIRFVIDGARADTWADTLLAVGAASVDTSDADADSEAECALFGEPGEPPPASAWPRTRMTVLLARGASRAGSADGPMRMRAPGPDGDGRTSPSGNDDGIPAADDDDRHAARDLLARAAAMSAQPLPAGADCDLLPDDDWVQATQRELVPFPVGRRLWITPSWHASKSVPEGRIAIELDPGLAFGTGGHPTTRLCLEWLDEKLRGGESLIDYGCGSGILAIAAARLGANPVSGIDIDPQALTAAEGNARANAVSIALRSSGDAIPAPADIVVANILANPLRVLAPLLETLVAPGGQLVLAGLLDRQVDGIARCYPRIALQAWRSLDGWTCLAGTRRR